MYDASVQGYVQVSMLDVVPVGRFIQRVIELSDETDLDAVAMRNGLSAAIDDLITQLNTRDD